MIASLQGTVIDRQDGELIVEVNGVGYQVFVPTPVSDAAEVGRQAQLRTHLHVRERELTLFGFADAEELDIFRTLISVSGIGPKVALAIQSSLSVETLKQAVARDEAAALTRVPGIGAKKAKQIVFQLKGKITYDDVFDMPSAPVIHDSDGEVVEALTTLGYSLVEAQMALQNLPPDSREAPVEDKIRLALSNLARL